MKHNKQLFFFRANKTIDIFRANLGATFFHLISSHRSDTSRLRCLLHLSCPFNIDSNRFLACSFFLCGLFNERKTWADKELKYDKRERDRKTGKRKREKENQKGAKRNGKEK